MSDQSDQDIVFVQGGLELVRIHPDGTLNYGESYSPDEAARVFWQTLGAYRAIPSEDDATWKGLWEGMQKLYASECERTARLRSALETLATSLDEIGETHLGKVARARAADA